MASNSIDPLADPLSALSFGSPPPSESISKSVATTSWTKHDFTSEPFSSGEAVWGGGGGGGGRVERDEVVTPDHPQAIPIQPTPSADHVLAGSFGGTSVTPRNNTFSSNLDIDLSSTPSASNSLALRFNTPQASIYNSAGAIDLEILNSLIRKACEEGELFRLKSLLEGEGNGGYPSKFDLANTASLHAAQTPLGIAARHGQLEVVKYLIKEAGALIDLENGEGETPLHRASHHGHFEVSKALLEAGANVNAEDKDGWTPLHNSASAGRIDLVKYFVETASAVIDKQSQHGYSVLSNASAQGHLPIVQFLIKHGANPFLRNAYQETAFDLAASVFEISICAVLANYERSFYLATSTSSTLQTFYNPLTFHTTVPVILEENQRLARPSLRRVSSLGNLAVGQSPRWSSKALSKNDKRAAFTYPLQLGSSSDEDENRPVFRSEVGLPVIGNEGEVISPLGKKAKGKGVAGRRRAVSTTELEGSTKSRSKPTRRVSASSSLSAVLGSTAAVSSPLAESTTPSNSASSQAEGGEPAWYWLSDWIVDLTHQSSSPLDGWSYASRFDAPLEEWSSEPLPELILAMKGNGGLSGQKWVRRRRWVRIMRRRLDIPGWGFGGNSAIGGTELIREEEGEEEGVEMQDESTKTLLPPGDYLAKARILAGEDHSKKPHRDGSIRSGITPIAAKLNRTELVKAVARLERASEELRDGMLIDEDAERRRQALDQSELYSHQLMLIKEELGTNQSHEDEEDSDDEFIYSGADIEEDSDEEVETSPSIRRPASVRSRSSYLSHTSSPPSYSVKPLPDLVPQLSGASEFRVPTHEVSIAPPPLVILPTPTTAIWQNDSSASTCSDCSKPFTFFLRKHHCRKCGQVFCSSCSNNVDHLTPQQLVKEPGVGGGGGENQWSLSSYRTCDACHLNLSLPSGSEIASAASVSAFFPPSPIIGGSNSPSLAGGSESGRSDASELAYCPVCNFSLEELAKKEEQEKHVQNCLETGGGAIARNGSYLVFKLPADSRLVRERDECGICYVEFETGDKVARLPCWCEYHLPCIRSWLERGKSCPFHARS